jgi:CDP-6-deoxy-D-xylo-4-hexulose-3-dehydrase
MPVSKPARYPLADSTFDRQEIDAAKAVLDSGHMTMGPQVAAFEKEFAAWVGAPHALMVNSGSSANLLMVDALLRSSKAHPALQPGDEVLVPALAWPTTVWPLLQLGLVPVFVDIDPANLAIDVDSAKSCLTSKTKAMFLIHVLGQTADMRAITAFCGENKLALIEDVCESLGAFEAGRHAGLFGRMGSFSCYFSHHISTIEGGVIVTADQNLYDDLKSLRSHGWIRDRSDFGDWVRNNPDIDPRFMFIMPGYNVRPTEINAAIGRVQLQKLDSMLAAREALARAAWALAEKYTPWMSLVGARHLENSVATRNERRHSWMTLPFLLRDGAPANVARVKSALEEAGVETRPIIAGNLARHPASRAHRIRGAASLKHADAVLEKGFMIGCHPLKRLDDLSVLEDAFKKASKIARG